MLNPRKKVSLLGIAFTLLLAGCASGTAGGGHAGHSVDISMEPIKVELEWSPAEVTVSSPVTFEAKVTQEGKPVDDAKEVLFEIVNKDGKTEKMELKGTSAGEGKYTAEGTFDKEGLYNVTSHVSARTQHSMPSKELTVKPLP
ncbi:FixH family protein [Paenibacillus sp. GCM10012306]|uniref:FixH family protein n=1 Tax=Paenibacillus sp. GCM10012306 TaxID=3317342 RepID=UPI00361776AE